MLFKVTVFDAGQFQTVSVDARDEPEVHRLMKAKGSRVLACRKVPRTRRRRHAFSLALFTQELIALLQAGLSLVESVETLREKSPDGESREVLTQMIDGLYQGLPLSRVLGQMPLYFPALYAATVSSSERTGHLAEALGRYHHYETRLSAVRKKVVSALIYPAVVIAIGGGIMVFLLFFVIPRFSEIYASMRELPAAARVLLWWGIAVKHHGGWIALGIAAAFAAVVSIFLHPACRAWMARQLWRIPQLRAYQHLFSLTRFYRTTGLLLAGGLPVVTAMSMAAQLLPAPMRKRLGNAIEDVRAGQSLSSTLPRYGLTTPVAERLLRVGEQSGELATMCERAALFCDDELDKAIDMVTKLVEPVLMLVVGILVGGIVFLLYMPIFQLAGNMQ
ncbi:type II secretion system F family protein [Pararobbsia alpina]|uniref:General secretion pathway protein F n=1 Tax=Pararobbsia alpina TaxID=621374 RepID=A0A6S7B157_9BURK|nr:type II secretion system F family protein [Pararobbsia alpina]CAB3776274.1 Putative type II secretion system protein F [Pararobbsia alpina]